jgi:hypothetical protein
MGKHYLMNSYALIRRVLLEPDRRHTSERDGRIARENAGFGQGGSGRLNTIRSALNPRRRAPDA